MALSRTTAASALLVTLLLSSSAALADRIDINTASATELESLPGIGPKLATEIVRDREENGAFSSPEDLSRVPGISSNLVEKLLAQISTGGETLVIREGQAIPADAVRKILESYDHEPSIREVQEAAIGYSRSHPDTVDSWRARARTSALLPQFQSRVRTDFDRDVRTRTNLDAADAVVQTDDNDNSLLLEVRATWELDRVVFNPDELGVWRETMRMANLRDRVVDEVTRRYYERRRLQVDLELTPPTNVSDRVRKELRIQELTADIDAVTGGWFSKRLRKAGSEPY
jgi:competence ComEA-like helix-hairpin-helix protein